MLSVCVRNTSAQAKPLHYELLRRGELDRPLPLHLLLELTDSLFADGKLLLVAVELLQGGAQLVDPQVLHQLKSLQEGVRLHLDVLEFFQKTSAHIVATEDAHKSWDIRFNVVLVLESEWLLLLSKAIRLVVLHSLTIDGVRGLELVFAVFLVP